MTHCKNQLQENLFIVNAVSIIIFIFYSNYRESFRKSTCQIVYFTLYSENENVDALNYYIHSYSFESVVTAPSPFECTWNVLPHQWHGTVQGGERTHLHFRWVPQCSVWTARGSMYSKLSLICDLLKCASILWSVLSSCLTYEINNCSAV